MPKKFVAACVQNNATPDVDFNIETALRLAERAADAGAGLICTPEYFSGLRTENGFFHPAAFAEAEHPVLPAFAAAAREWKVWFLLGSLGVLARDGRIFNRAYVLDSEGAIAARYDKIHMFDVVLDSGPYVESATIAPGDRSVVAQTPWGGLGLSICYDLRFAPLYRQLAHNGATMLAAPAAFTKVTGEAHWHVLNRARAIEHGCYMISPCQYGGIEGGGACFGHSLIVDPWGAVLADGGDGEGIVMAEIDPERVAEARAKIPALDHDRPITPEAPPLSESPAAVAAE
ncbi:MAG: carbon-nitrogen hydrolase family protein [Rhodospirillaceae bacterium]|nr:carbon-nitrogen hydrolase family protein [Rhodospirillaceae bacterium]MDE0618035.1 carbon-nitrogen hydrolase family protein [Rhodospirillaceae bacterium]